MVLVCSGEKEGNVCLDGKCLEQEWVWRLLSMTGLSGGLGSKSNVWTFLLNHGREAPLQAADRDLWWLTVSWLSGPLLLVGPQHLAFCRKPHQTRTFLGMVAFLFMQLKIRIVTSFLIYRSLAYGFLREAPLKLGGGLIQKLVLFLFLSSQAQFSPDVCSFNL